MLHTVVKLGPQQIQIITLYGLPGTQKDSLDFNNELFRQALTAASLINLPTIILGDFNVDPFSLPISQELQQKGFKDLPQLHMQRFGIAMPPTCRDGTNPDNALLSPELQHLLLDFAVQPEHWFDTHKVVTLTFRIPGETIAPLRLTLPHTFLHLPLDHAYLEPAFE